MKIYFFSTAVLLITCIPFFADASVLISEVAWMGSETDANAEWIELYNDGPSQDVSGWTLSATDGQPSITLSGVIGANVYALLERSDDSTMPAVSAFLIYTGAMGNTGEILELRTSSGTLIDRVDGSGDWSIGGDNATKETLQRQGDPAVGSWTTALATPKGGILETQEETSSTVSTEEAKSIHSYGGNIIYGVPDKKEEKTYLEPALIIDVGDDEQTVTKDVSTDFIARTYKEGGKEIVSVEVEWNFGDGSIGKGKVVQHTYRYTGDYVVSAKATRTGFLEEISDEVRIIVHVVEPAVVITSVNSKYVEVENRSEELVELSGFVFVSENSHFRIPENTFVLPKAHVCLPSKTTNITTNGSLHLFTPDGVLASTFGAVAPSPIIKKDNTTVASVYSSQPKVAQEQDVEDISLPNIMTMQELFPTANAYEGNEQSGKEQGSMWWWLLGLVTAIATALVAILLFRHEQQEVIDGFIIETEIEDSDLNMK